MKEKNESKSSEWKPQEHNIDKMRAGKYTYVTPVHEPEPYPMTAWHTCRQYLEVWDGEKWVLVSTRYYDCATDNQSQAIKDVIEGLEQKQTLEVKAIAS